jgi:hypothetical protein
MCLPKNRDRTISVEQKQNDSGPKMVGRIVSLRQKNTPIIVDPEHATRHAAEALGATVALRIWAI